MSADWLSQLAPEHAPAAPHWWPPAPGWWVLSALLVAAALAGWWWLRRPGRPAGAVRRAALGQLRLIRASDADGAAVARATENLLRRYAVAVFGAERVARLTGEAWLRFVVDAGGHALAGGPGRSLLAAAFGNHDVDDRQHWIAGAEAFIKHAGARARRAARADARPQGPGYHGHSQSPQADARAQSSPADAPSRVPTAAAPPSQGPSAEAHPRLPTLPRADFGAALPETPGAAK